MEDIDIININKFNEDFNTMVVKIRNLVSAVKGTPLLDSIPKKYDDHVKQIIEDLNIMAEDIEITQSHFNDFNSEFTQDNSARIEEFKRKKSQRKRSPKVRKNR